MAVNAKYAHTNIVAKDWRALAEFYVGVFGCESMPAERNHHGVWVDRATGIPGAHIRGVHLRLPGFGDDGPTLEIFEYNRTADGPEPAINRPGLTHLAFQVDDVAAAQRKVLEAGGRDYGEFVTTAVPGAGTIQLIYMTDPEGNIIELQRWTD